MNTRLYIYSQKSDIWDLWFLIFQIFDELKRESAKVA